MTEPFLGEVQIFGFNFAPVNWALAAGQVVPIRQYSGLYSLYGITFGGDGVNTFSLPNLASRMACGGGQSPGNTRRTIGQPFGSTGVSLTAAEMPMHNHVFADYQIGDASKQTGVPTMTSAVGSTNTSNIFAPLGQVTTLNGNAIGISGGGAPHENRQPFLGLAYAVALSGVFPAFN